jgi:hypothetical protein
MAFNFIPNSNLPSFTSLVSERITIPQGTTVYMGSTNANGYPLRCPFNYKPRTHHYWFGTYDTARIYASANGAQGSIWEFEFTQDTMLLNLSHINVLNELTTRLTRELIQNEVLKSADPNKIPYNDKTIRLMCLSYGLGLRPTVFNEFNQVITAYQNDLMRIYFSHTIKQDQIIQYMLGFVDPITFNAAHLDQEYLRISQTLIDEDMVTCLMEFYNGDPMIKGYINSARPIATNLNLNLHSEICIFENKLGLGGGVEIPIVTPIKVLHLLTNTVYTYDQSQLSNQLSNGYCINTVRTNPRLPPLTQAETQRLVADNRYAEIIANSIAEGIPINPADINLDNVNQLGKSKKRKQMRKNLRSNRRRNRCSSFK